MEHFVRNILDNEFFLVNATTTLLWLFQNIDHKVLVGLIVLGAVCVLVGSCVLAVRTIQIIFSLFNLLVIVLFNTSRFLCRILIPKNPFRLHFSISPRGTLPRASGNLPPGFIVDRELEIDNRLANTDRQLSLPQSLALSPDRWAEIEVCGIQPQRLARETQARQLATRPAGGSRTPLRRSRRLLRARVCDPCIYSS